jgi:N-methylhydantoinase A
VASKPSIKLEEMLHHAALQPAAVDTSADFIVGIDVGGTFADLICVSRDGMWTQKTPSRPDAPGADIVEGMRQIAASIGLSSLGELLRRTQLIFHGSTIATNTLLTLTGAAVGLITTRGFRDIIEMRGGRRESTFDSHLVNAPPLAARHMRLEVDERVGRDGDLTVPVTRSQVAAAAETLVAAGAEAIAVAFKHSALNAANEERARSWIAEVTPGRFVSSSADISRRPRLYDRTSSAVVNAYVGPASSGYIVRLAAQLQELGFAGELLIMGSSGGVMSVPEACRVPVQLLLSGPAAGPIGAALALPKTTGDAAIVVDMGGTSFDVCVLRHGIVATTSSRDVNRYRIGVPMLDIHTIGAGGGSIARVDETGLLQVGPGSAGAIPGPAAYGLGGKDPTVTDANLVLGMLDPNALLGNARKLSLPRARKSIEKIARRLGLSAGACAAGIRSVANGAMVAAVREMTVGRGLDPRGLVLVAGGGAGPLHAADIAADLGIRTVIVPGHAGVLCALGMVASDLIYETTVSVVRNIDAIDGSALRASLGAARREFEQRLRSSAAAVNDISTTFECEARYEGQFHELLVNASEDELAGQDRLAFVRRFHETHEAAYGFRSEGAQIEIVNVRVKVRGSLKVRPRARLQRTRSSLRLVQVGRRSVLLGRGSQEADVPVLRSQPTVGSATESRAVGPVRNGRGPTLIDLPTTTVFVPPGWSFAVTAQGDVRLSRRRVGGSRS